MKFVRATIWTILAVIGVLTVVLAIFLTSSGLQTRLAKHFLPDGVDVKRVDLGLKGLTINNLSYSDQKLSLKIDRIDSSFSLISALTKRHLHITELSTSSISCEMLEVSQETHKPQTVGKPEKKTSIPPGKPLNNISIPWEKFAGFKGVMPASFKWPPITIDQISAPVKIRLAGKGGDVDCRIKGVSLGVGMLAQITAELEYSAPDKKSALNSVHLDNELSLKISEGGLIDSIRIKSLVDANISPSKTKPYAARGVLDFTLARNGENAGESYRLKAFFTPESGAPVEISDLNVSTHGRGSFAGSWKINLVDMALQSVTKDLFKGATVGLQGAGDVEIYAAAEKAVASGNISLKASSLEKLNPELSELPEINADLQFKAEASGQHLGVDQWKMEFNAPADNRLVEIKSVQPFTFDLKQMKAVFEDQQKPLLTMKLNGLPLALVNSLLPATKISMTSLTGMLALSAPNGNLRLSTDTPLNLRGLHVADGDSALVDNLDLSISAVLTYADSELGLDVSDLLIKQGEQQILSMASAGSISGQLDKFVFDLKSNLSLDLAGLSRQPLARQYLQGVRGLVKGDIVATGSKEQPNLSSDLRVDELRTAEDITLSKVHLIADINRDLASINEFSAFYGESPIQANGLLKFGRVNPFKPYILNGSLSASNFDLGSFMRKVDPGREPALEAVASLQADLKAEAKNVEGLAESLDADIYLSATQGIFRGLRNDRYGSVLDLAGRGAQLAGRLTGKQDTEAIGNLVTYFNEVRFSDFAMNMHRKKDGSIDVRDLMMRNDDLLLQGEGQIGNQTGLKLYEQAIDFSLKLGTRPPLRKLFDSLHMLEEVQGKPDGAEPDAYTYLKRPVKLKGQLNRPNSKEFWESIAKASLDRLSGGGGDGKQSDTEKIINGVRSALGF